MLEKIENVELSRDEALKAQLFNFRELLPSTPISTNPTLYPLLAKMNTEQT